MDSNKILSADLLDLLFDNRNKDYGAYELRKTYNRRVTKAVLITFSITGIVLAGSVLASSMQPPKDKALFIRNQVEIQNLPEDEPEPLPEPEPQPEPEQPVRTEQYTEFNIVNEDVDPPPTQEELSTAKIDVKDNEGVDDNNIIGPPTPPGEGKGVVDAKETDEGPLEWGKVEIDAKFNGDWTKFLLKNLRGEVPVDNDAPPGRHSVMIQFVVDVDGTVSDIKALTNIGYGMEEEALRVLRKAAKWEPAIQNGRKVKAYRRQQITFEVVRDE